VTQILVNRLKGVLPNLISQEQSAFVNDRVIMDNILVAQGILHSMGSKREGKKFMAIKIDMERAYDMMRWDYLKAVLGKFGFAEDFIALIMGCIARLTLQFLLMAQQQVGSSQRWVSGKVILYRLIYLCWVLKFSQGSSKSSREKKVCYDSLLVKEMVILVSSCMLMIA